MTEPTIHMLEDAWKQRDSNRTALRACAANVLADSAAEPSTAVLAYILCAYADFRERRYESALAACLTALPTLTAHQPTHWLARLYGALAAIHIELGERDTARQYLEQQLYLSQMLNDQVETALGYHDLGLLQAALDAERGLATLAEARVLFAALGDQEHEALALYNMANTHLHHKEYPAAAQRAQDALALVSEATTAGLGAMLMIHLSTLLADLADRHSDPAQAQVLLENAATMASRLHPELLPHVLYCQGLHQVAQAAYAEAISFLHQALLTQSTALHYDLRIDCHASLADCYEQIGDFRSALEHYRAAAGLRERVFRESNEEKVRALEILHELESARQAVAAERQHSRKLEHSLQELKEIQSSLQALSLRDALTGLYNRRFLDDEGLRHLQASRRQHQALCLAMIDVDGFKQINDRYGHARGDSVLQHLAAMLTQTLRISDVLVRYGGEEFCLLLPFTTLAQGQTLCERLRSLVAGHEWEPIQPELHVTISIGLAEDDGGSLDELLVRADEYLYRAKQAGRNQVCVAP